ncbi:NAD+ synthetase [Campylobacter sputorum subsp. bubulus]|uniref:NH(3)-dependent NAD(+) synthetase n=1 Tax=Campylobacter sputorum subsp. sputorum TaxID=32024 RepID=A0A381DHH0_9BACT|nr:NAD+ synthase [Campylobacter sputorum]ASM35033.1 NAD synthetase, NH3-dependent [Campylobacter sputorum aubsp. sputorum RM3237]ASM36699.1 NAD synthetase, NH3-dependent [Campylobacter sputorum bv. faecalis CCUG 20703]KAB0581364.1 NAD+ synthase [Campylobacter sputorum subsp. sputorum]QEL05223.1 NAD synthetase, NH3-dependent [Campylobacter sputorum subsp. sputorum]SUX08977.1 NAD+ synthetase [Campylobacter sputorum subsp. bubulus]
MGNYSDIHSKILNFLESNLNTAKNFIIGVSGGLDSAIVATLCAQVSTKNTYALLLPTKISNAKNLEDGINLCKMLGINYKIISIEPILQAYKVSIDENLNNIRLGNLCARIRMSLLYDYSAKISGFVVGTSNKSELMLGYGTIFGDMACAINPIGEIFKSDIFEFAKFLKIDKTFIEKKPSADLWENQCDESDLGYNYSDLDTVLKDISKNGINKADLYNKFDKNLVDRVLHLVNKNSFKLHPPKIAKIH